MAQNLTVRQIGVIRTPYIDSAPRQPVEGAEGEFCIVLDEKYAEGLAGLEEFRHIYVVYYLHRGGGTTSMTVSPPCAPEGVKVGLFASRSPARPSPLGISVVRLKKISGRRIFVSGLDALDKTPLVDIKPYIKELDSRPDANRGWIDDS